MRYANWYYDIRKLCSIIKRWHTTHPVLTRKAVETTADNYVRATLSTPQSAKRIRTQSGEKTTQEEQEGTKVGRQKMGKTAKAITPGADAFIIAKKSDGMSYATIFKAVKSKVKVRLAAEMRTIRDDAPKYQAIIEKALADVAMVDLRTHMATVQARNLILELSTTYALLDALVEKPHTKRPDKSAVRSTRASYRGTNAVYIQIPTEDAKTLALWYLRVGWMRCGVSEIVSPKHYYRRWGYEHAATVCKEPERTK